MKKLSVALAAGSLAIGLLADTYYWSADPSAPHSFAEPANWSTEGVAGSPAKTIPSSADTLYGRQNFNFDLGGGSFEIGTWDTTSEWTRYVLTLANGTLAVKSGVYTHSGTVNVLNGGRWILDGTFRPAQADAAQHIVNVEAGGEFQINGAYRDYKSEFHIKAGGHYVYNPTVFSIYWGSAQNSLCEVAGVMDAPKGVNWTEAGFSNDSNSYTYALKDGAVLNLGGSFNRNGQRGRLVLACEGVRLAATADVSFLQTECSLAEGKALTVDVAADATLDLTPFVCGEGSSVIKEGPGTLRLGATSPTMLEIQNGRVVIAEPNVALGELIGSAGCLEIAASGFSLGNLSDEGTTFAVAAGVFATGDVFFTSFNPAIRGKVKADVEAAGMAVVEEGDALKVGGSAYIFNSKTVTDLMDASGWDAGTVPPDGAEVTIAGSGVVVELGASVPFGSVTVKDGAAVHVHGEEVALPPLRLLGTASLTISGQASSAVALNFLPDEEGEIPSVAVATGGSLKLPGGSVFKNCALDLKGELVATSPGGFVFGSAAAEETATFAMTAEGATIRVVNPAGASNLSRIDFVAPAAGGTVVVREPIVLKQTVVNPDKTRDGITFGLNNPIDVPFQVVADAATLNCGWDSIVSGAATLSLTNNALLLRARHGEGDNGDYYYELFVREYGKITLSRGGEIRAGVGRVNGNLTDGAIRLEPAEPGWAGLEVLEGGIGCWYKLNGSNAGVLRVADGTIECFKSYWWGWGNRNHLFYGLQSVEIPEGTTMTFKGVPDKLSTGDRRLTFFELEAPFAGAGDLVLFNTWAGTTMEPTLFRGDNTCTGTLTVSDGETANAKTKLHFADGANWAGCVTLNGNVDLVPVDGNRTATAGNPATVSFGGANLTAPFTLRVWVTKDEATGMFAVTNDVINVGAQGWTIGEAGGLASSTQTSIGLADVPPNTRFVIGRIPKAGEVPPSLSALMVLSREPIPGDDAEDLLVARTAAGSFVFTGKDGSTDLNNAAAWDCGYVPVGEEVTIRGPGVTARLSAEQGLPRFASVALREGATLQVVGADLDGSAFVLPSVAADATSALVIGDEQETPTSFALPALFVTDVENDGAELTRLVVHRGAELVVAGGTRLKNVAVTLNGVLTKGAGVVDGQGPIIGYAENGETSYIAFTGDQPQFQIHSNQNADNGRVAFVNPELGGRVKVVGDIVLKNADFPVNGWADMGTRSFGVNNPTDEPFTVVLDGTKIDSPWSFIAAGAAHLKLVNGSKLEKNWSCRNHGFDNYLREAAQIEIADEGSYLDFAGGANNLRIDSAEHVDAVRVGAGGTYLAQYVEGANRGVFVGAGGVCGVGKLVGTRARGDLFCGFASVRIEDESNLTLKALNLGNADGEWERRVQMANIPVTGAGDLIVDNALEAPFAVTLVNGANTCTGTLRVTDAAETTLFLASGANWAGPVAFNGHVALTNLVSAADPVRVTLGGVRLEEANLKLRVWKQDDVVATDTVNLTGPVTTAGNAVVELVPVAGAEEIVPRDVIPLGTAPAGAYAQVQLKLNGHTLKVFEEKTGIPGLVVCTARICSGTQLILR